MSYTYNLDSKTLFQSRYDQFIAFGIPKTDVDALKSSITDMWADAPGGWAFEWSAVAKKYADQGNQLLASTAYGYAKFPCLANDAHKKALANQVTTFLAAAHDFSVKFERRILSLPYLGGKADLPVHLYSVSGNYNNEPVLMFSGGVDTYKMDNHNINVALAQKLGVTVLAFDIPGTAENPVPLTIAGDELILGLVAKARLIGNGKVAHFGLSYGGNYSAMTGLNGIVDASIVLGGPLFNSFTKENLSVLPFGMPGIIGNDIGFDHEPGKAELLSALLPFGRRDIFDDHGQCPMIVINGADDSFVPQSDTLVFQGRSNTEVHLLPNTGHCAVTKLPEVLDLIFSWLPKHIGISDSSNEVDAKLQVPLPVATPESMGFSTERIQQMDDAIQKEINAGHYAGISVMVARHGKLVKSKRYGFQTLEHHDPLREDAIYRIASMTKPIIATAMMILYEEGKWLLDDAVTNFIPEFKDLKVMTADGTLVPLERTMTMRHIMSTSAGFAFGPLFGSTNPKVDQLYTEAGLWSGTNDDMIAKLAKLPLEAQPGTEFRYGLQQEVQGAIIRRITGQGLDVFLEERIFTPLRMKDTGFGVAEDQRDRITPRYELDKNLQLVLAADQSAFPTLVGTPPGVVPKMILSIAGLYSTTQDYIRFAQMLANKGALEGARILSPTSVKLMTSNLLADGVHIRFNQSFEGLGYGMNLGIVLDPARADFNGGAVGKGTFYWGGVHGTWFWVDPVYDIVCVGMFQQVDGGNPMTGRPYPVPNVCGIAKSIIYGALLDAAM